MPITDLPGGGQVMTPALRMPPGSPIPGSDVPGAAGPPGGPPSAPEQGQGGTGVISLDDAIQAFNSPNAAGKVNGRVFLVGEIVNNSRTSGDIEVALTDHNDRETVAHFVPQWAGRLHFVFVQGEPNEPWVEVTPGTEPHPGGPSIEDLVGTGQGAAEPG